MTIAALCVMSPQPYPESGALGQTITLASIVTLPEMQPRTIGLHLPTLRRYKQAMEAGEVFPPILLAGVNGALVLVDGWHRLEAMRALGLWEGVAEVRNADSMAEARLWGYEANRKGIEMAIQWAFEQKIIPRRLSLDELFDDVTASLNP